MEFSREVTLDKRSGSKLSLCLEKPIKRITSFSKMNPFRLSRRRDKNSSDTKLTTQAKKGKKKSKQRHSISNDEIVQPYSITSIHPFHDTSANKEETAFSVKDDTDNSSFNKLFVNGDNFLKNFEISENTFSKNNLEFQSLTAMINAMKDW